MTIKHIRDDLYKDEETSDALYRKFNPNLLKPDNHPTIGPIFMDTLGRIEYEKLAADIVLQSRAEGTYIGLTQGRGASKAGAMAQEGYLKLVEVEDGKFVGFLTEKALEEVARDRMLRLKGKTTQSSKDLKALEEAFPQLAAQ